MALSKYVQTSNRILVADLYQQFAPALLMYLRRQLPTKEDAEDVLLEVFQAALESNRLQDLDTSRQGAWLWGVARHKCSDHLRRARKQAGLPMDDFIDALYADDVATPEFVTLRQEARTLLRQHLATLSEQQQRVLLLRFGHGLRCSEIAIQLSKSQEAIRATLSRALNLLRHRYSENGEEKTDA